VQRDGQHATSLLHEAIDKRHEPDGGYGDFVGAEKELPSLLGQDGQGLGGREEGRRRVDGRNI
jgi:hypothetical protein